MAKFAKGNSGRPKGATNLATRKAKEKVEKILSSSVFTQKQIIADIQELEPKERLDVYIKLNEFIIPKLARVKADVGGELTIKGIDLSTWK